MKSIPINFQELFLARGVMVRDSDRQLVFRGLDLLESEFFMKYVSAHAFPCAADETRFYELRHRHLSAMVTAASQRDSPTIGKILINDARSTG